MPAQPAASVSRLSRAGAIAFDILIAIAIIWVPIAVLAGIAALLSGLFG